MKILSYIPAVALIALASLASCQDDYESVENRVYDTAAVTPTSVLVDGSEDEITQTFTINLATPAPSDIEVTYGVDPQRVEEYNTLFNEDAVILPEKYYELVQTKATIYRGGVNSTEVEILFKELKSLNRDLVYVLPLTITDTPIPVLESQKTRFIVVRGAALVNVAANMVENNASLINPNNASGLNGLSTMTFQCIFNVDEWGGADSNIQTIAGIEGKWLLRISDSGVDKDQLQFVTPSGNLTDSSWKFKAKQWVRMTFTWNAATSEATLYIDGVKKATAKGRTTSAIDWGSDNFYIGKSWNDNRWLNGAICEVRVWNRILTDAEIANERQAYTVAPDSEGLVSYWKFDEGAGTLIHDYANGYDINCVATPKWINVSLPE